MYRDGKHMIKSEWYELNPLAKIHGKKFKRVQCEDPIPNKPNEYIVRGIPEGEAKMESFVLIFGKDKGVMVTRTTPPSHLCLVK